MIVQALYAKVGDKEMFYPKIIKDAFFHTFFYIDFSTYCEIDNCGTLMVPDDSPGGLCRIPYPTTELGITKLISFISELEFKKLSVTSHDKVEIYWQTIPQLEHTAQAFLFPQLLEALETVVIAQEEETKFAQSQEQKYSKFQFISHIVS